jgi:formiminotetrahydrofolate cyclodeaminase
MPYSICYQEENAMYFDEPLQTYIDELASAQPTPGGGSASALGGAMGAALASMVARLTLNKPEYADVREQIEDLLQQSEAIRARFQLLMQADIDAYGLLSNSYKMPRGSDEERAMRSAAIQQALKSAALVPLEMVERSAQLVQCCQRIALIGNIQVLSDVATGTLFASSAGAGAAWMVRANLQSMKDEELVNELSDRLSTALNLITIGSQQVLEVVGERA